MCNIKKNILALLLVVATVVTQSTLFADTVSSRLGDWQAATNKLIPGQNYHGTAQDPDGDPASKSYWSYYWQTGVQEYGGSTANPSNGLWTALPPLTVGSNTVYGISVSWPTDHVAVDANCMEVMGTYTVPYGWDPCTPLSPAERRPAWAVAVWHNPTACMVSLDGTLIYQLLVEDFGTVSWSIGKVSAAGGYMELYHGWKSNVVIGTYAVADLGDIPELQNIKVEAGGGIAFCMVGNRYDHRMNRLWDNGITMTVSAPCEILTGDLNKDCKVDFLDLSRFSIYWLGCTELDPNDCL